MSMSVSVVLVRSQPSGFTMSICSVKDVYKRQGIIGQNRKAQPLVFRELLCFCSDALCAECRCAGRLVRGEVKVGCQTLRRFIERQAEQLCGKVDHISMFPAGEAMVVVVCHIQAGVPVIVERAKGHAVMVDLHAVPPVCGR